MKRIFFALVVVILAFGTLGQEYSEGKIESILQKAKNEDKVALLKFYSDTCSWCKKLDKEVLVPENLTKLSRLAVIYRINVKTEEGKTLREKFNIKGVPTVILLSGDGIEIDRIVGYENKDDFIKELLSYIFNIGTLSQLTSKSEKEPSYELFYTIASKYYERGDSEKALEYIKKAKVEKNITDKEREKLDLLEGEVLLKKEPENGIKILTTLLEKGSNDVSETVFEELTRYFKNNKDYENLIATYRKLLKNKQDDPSFLNSFAWTMAEIDRNLPEALEAAKKAAALSNEDPQILDTLAEVYFKIGDLKSAILTIDKAISKEPNDEYFKKQREKFSAKNKTGK